MPKDWANEVIKTQNKKMRTPQLTMVRYNECVFKQDVMSSIVVGTLGKSYILPHPISPFFDHPPPKRKIPLEARARNGRPH